MIRKLTPDPSDQASIIFSQNSTKWIDRRWKSLRRVCRRQVSLPVIFFSLAAIVILLFFVFATFDPLNATPTKHHYDPLILERINEDVNDTEGTLPVPLTLAKNEGRWAGLPISMVAKSELRWNYVLLEKQAPYIGDPYWMQQFSSNSRHYYNSLAVVKGSDANHMHGQLGIKSDGSNVWMPAKKPPPIEEFPGGKDAALKQGGFYLALSDTLPLSRIIPDLRDNVCKNLEYNYSALGDASIIITFFNEPISTLMRTVHSVLNYSPPPLLREVILVDDHSDSEENRPGGILYEHVELLPKVKLMRLPERKGIVHARIAGAKAAKGSVLVVLDSHVEVNPGWLEPQLDRIREVPESIVFPQILSLTHDTLERKVNSGIGCWLTFRWVIVEQAMLTGKVTTTEAKPSPSMAGGLFAIDRDWFWELGGYDEEFVAWGAENVEMAFRAWMCGGRVECVPCSQTYHIYRKGGSGYFNPPGALWQNRKRTARLWMDEFYQLAAPMIDMSSTHGNYDGIGNIDKMLELKQRLQCKSFKWYLENVDPTHDVQDLSEIMCLGRLQLGEECIDLAGSRVIGHKPIMYPCHPKEKLTSNQGFLVSRYCGGFSKCKTNTFLGMIIAYE
eukprot:Gregarina_sp_Poly_1__11202@NODE_919_length_5716_cov_103_478315_g84_i3_p2_GENE_NODE_919_length_5716_cov_103_478315_g84_i3NODE_919_length_5716_cov_103_478315_g84_i3_p2_ORF_typecomplete_len616_score52_70Glycos_transf_2/PF00535_26/2_9e23Glyco_tranf_2_3/PF13641_6/1_1e21Glyco_transf_7C/PF02709_14/1_8e16Glyco_tranf_2_2/PF10111_9/7_7e15Glyco_transf_21/PF13506_6/6_9e05Glyco_trans_2_3/PF13632_6/1_2e03Glyco_trans_2_3/PF13632_6/0_049Ferlin_C/PF16165_5/0_24_NODE_919_length_5716_cov_103_478315_g84_i338275674